MESKTYCVASDIDETITNIAPKLAYLYQKDVLGQQFVTTEEIMNRKVFCISNFLPQILQQKYSMGRLTYEDGTQVNKVADLKKLIDKIEATHILEIYKDHEATFYDDLELNFFGNYLKQIAFQFNQLHFVSHHGTNDTCTDSKKRFLERSFGDLHNNNIFFHPLDQTISKTEVLDNIEWDIYYDDRPSIFKDIFTKSNMIKADKKKSFGLINQSYSMHEQESPDATPTSLNRYIWSSLKLFTDYGFFNLSVCNPPK